MTESNFDPTKCPTDREILDLLSLLRHTAAQWLLDHDRQISDIGHCTITLGLREGQIKAEGSDGLRHNGQIYESNILGTDSYRHRKDPRDPELPVLVTGPSPELQLEVKFWPAGEKS